MKTLNEVIKAFSEVNKEVGCGDCYFNDAESDDIPCELNDCIFNDALHYLRKYRATMDDIEAERMLYFKAMERETYNPPLTWDELKQMEGKPVWVETQWTRELDPEWMVIHYLLKFEDGTEALLTSCGLLDQKRQSVTWQAYRKERK